MLFNLPIEGIPQKLKAFNEWNKKNPKLLDKSKFYQLAKKYAKSIGASVFFRINGGRMKGYYSAYEGYVSVNGEWVYTKSGIPDFVIIKDGQTIRIESKRGGDKFSQAQEDFIIATAPQKVAILAEKEGKGVLIPLRGEEWVNTRFLEVVQIERLV